MEDDEQYKLYSPSPPTTEYDVSAPAIARKRVSPRNAFRRHSLDVSSGITPIIVPNQQQMEAIAEDENEFVLESCRSDYNFQYSFNSSPIDENSPYFSYKDSPNQASEQTPSARLAQLKQELEDLHKDMKNLRKTYSAQEEIKLLAGVLYQRDNISDLSSIICEINKQIRITSSEMQKTKSENTCDMQQNVLDLENESNGIISEQVDLLNELITSCPEMSFKDQALKAVNNKLNELEEIITERETLEAEIASVKEQLLQQYIYLEDQIWRQSKDPNKPTRIEKYKRNIVELKPSSNYEEESLSTLAPKIKRNVQNRQYTIRPTILKIPQKSTSHKHVSSSTPNPQFKPRRCSGLLPGSNKYQNPTPGGNTYYCDEEEEFYFEQVPTN